MESFKYPQTYILLGAPFCLLKQGNGSSEVLRQGALELLEHILTENDALIEVPRERMPDLVELDLVLRIELDPDIHGRAALLIWAQDQSMIRVEASLHNAQASLVSHGIAHIICLIRPSGWNDLKSNARAFMGTERTCVVHSPPSVRKKGHCPILAVRSSPNYSDNDKNVFAQYLKGEYPPSNGLSAARPGTREGEITMEFVVAEVAPDLLKGE